VAVLAVAAGAVAAGGFWLARAWTGSTALAREAREAIVARRFDEARRAIDRWVARHPEEGEPYYWRARLEVALDHPKEAIDAMDQAVRRGNDPAPIAPLRAVLLARAGRHQEAEPTLQKAFFEGKTFDPEVAEALSRIYLSSYRLSPASKVLERWIRESPGDYRPYLYMTEVDQRSDVDASVMINHYRMALHRDPTLDKARLGLADKLREVSRDAEAEIEYDAYLERNPGSVEGHIGAGQVALRQGDLPRASLHFSEVLAANPREPVALRELAQIDLRAGRWGQARDRLKTVVEADPYDPEVRLSYARALKMSGDEGGARRETDTVQRLRKEHAQMSELRKALVQRPDDPQLRFQAARWLLEHGHEAEALEWCRLILRNKPGHGETCRLLADYYERHGNAGLANAYRNAAGPAAGSAP
jgi:predicted Zn-dependent protease